MLNNIRSFQKLSIVRNSFLFLSLLFIRLSPTKIGFGFIGIKAYRPVEVLHRCIYFAHSKVTFTTADKAFCICGMFLYNLIVFFQGGGIFALFLQGFAVSQ